MSVKDVSRHCTGCSAHPARGLGANRRLRRSSFGLPDIALLIRSCNLSRDAKSTVNPADQLVRHRRCKVNCQTAIMCSVKSSKRLEYEDIPDLEYRKDVKHLLYSAEYSGLRSCQTPPIFQKNMRNIVERLSDRGRVVDGCSSLARR